jgi:hypothetical protein
VTARRLKRSQEWLRSFSFPCLVTSAPTMWFLCEPRWRPLLAVQPVELRASHLRRRRALLKPPRQLALGGRPFNYSAHLSSCFRSKIRPPQTNRASERRSRGRLPIHVPPRNATSSSFSGGARGIAILRAVRVQPARCVHREDDRDTRGVNRDIEM